MKRLVLIALVIAGCGWPRGEKKRLIAECEEGGRSAEWCACRYAEIEKTKTWKEYKAIHDGGGLPLMSTDLAADAQCAGRKLEEFIHGKKPE